MSSDKVAQSTSTTAADKTASESGASAGLKSKSVFALISRNINADTVKKVNATYRFDITSDNGSKDQAQSWLVDLKSGAGSVKTVTADTKADCVIAMKDSDFVLLMTGKLNPQAAYMKGKLKMKGNLLLAQKLSALMPKKVKGKPKSAETNGTALSSKL